MTAKRVLYLVDTKSYVRENCFQSQLLSAMSYCHDVTMLELHPDMLFGLRSILTGRPTSFDVVVSALRLRTLHARLLEIKKFLDGHPVRIYDQDPWESYIDGSATKGFYQSAISTLNIEKVFVTSPWWANRLRQDRVPAEFVRMGMSPRWCDAGPETSTRAVDVGFRGAMHRHRLDVFRTLGENGIKIVAAKGRLNYPDYMRYLHELKFFAHDESAPWICDGVEVSRSTGMWIKSVETAARGTFCLRNYHEEGEAYRLSEIPLLTCYKHPSEAVEIVDRILALRPRALREMQIESVEKIRSSHDWINAAVRLAA